MRIAIYDTETTGLDPAIHHPVELAVAIYDVDHASLVSCWSTIIQQPEPESIGSESVHGIPSAMLATGTPPEKAWARLRACFDHADVIAAHNAPFDRSMTPEGLRDVKPWICTMSDVAWPKGRPGMSLVAFALAHGVGVSSAHRAIHDVLTLASLFQRVQESTDLRALVVQAMRPKKTYAAQVSYDDREKAKAAGFTWNGGQRLWLRSMPPEDVSALPFPVKEVA